ncbi:MAG: arylsulfatase A-like enzyme [Planctomycetota bacterium]|jgi:arylsulfatase A-like enzyme
MTQALSIDRERTSLRAARIAPALRACLLAAVASACGGADSDATGAGDTTVRVELPTPYTTRPDILIVTIDTLRADHLGCYGYFRDTSPTIDALAAESILFERCIAPMATTLPVHASLFTGVWPIEHGVLANLREGRERHKLASGLSRAAELFQGARYQTAAFISALPLKRLCGLVQGFSVYEVPGTISCPAEPTTDSALAWIDTMTEKPFFLWVHYFDPHSPYEAPEPYASMYQDSPELEAYIQAREFAETAVRPNGKEGVLRPGINSYDAEIRYADSQLERLIQRLRELGRWDDTIVLLLADHGEGLNQHDAPGHGLNWDEQVHVPCLLKLPGVEPVRFPSLISVVDLFPTLLRRLELRPIERFLSQASGVDVLAADFEPRAVMSQSSERQQRFGNELTYSLTTGRWKSIITASGHERLYDLLNDPHELSDMTGQRPDILSRMRRQTMSLVESQQERGAAFGAGKTIPIDPEDAAGLRTLGYGGASDD